jgi:hypothetical protein
MDYKYISNETKKELEILKKHHEKIKNYTPKQARKELKKLLFYKQSL